MIHVICYDIPDNRVRQQLARWLDGFGDRIQDSVFEARLDPGLLDEMLDDVRRLVDLRTDMVAVVSVCGACAARRLWLGPRAPGWTDEEAVWVV